MIDFEKVSKIFEADILKGTKSFYALEDLSFSVKPGHLTGFLGANGAGKTTSLKILFQFIKATSGNVHYHSELGSSWGDIRSNIGYVPERPYFYPYLSGYEFLFFTARLNNIKRDQVLEKTKIWAERLGIAHALDRQIKGYSKGMLQRIGVLSCLMHDPKVIILDEPLSGLDPLGRTELKKVFIDLNKSGCTVFFSSHIVSDVEEVCDQVVVIDKGKLVYQGSVEQVLDENSKDEYLITVKHAGDEPPKLESLIEKETSSQRTHFLIAGDRLDSSLKSLVSQDCKIEKLQKQRISLEEFVYLKRKN